MRTAFSSNGLNPSSYFSNPPNDGWLESFSKVSFIKNDNNFYTLNIMSTAVVGNYIIRSGNCDDMLYREWFSNPALVKEIVLHN